MVCYTFLIGIKKFTEHESTCKVVPMFGCVCVWVGVCNYVCVLIALNLFVNSVICVPFPHSDKVPCVRLLAFWFRPYCLHSLLHMKPVFPFIVSFAVVFYERLSANALIQCAAHKRNSFAPLQNALFPVFLSSRSPSSSMVFWCRPCYMCHFSMSILHVAQSSL